MHNPGYLPIPLVAAILPEGQREEGLLYTFMFILVMGLLFWSLGIRLISGASPDPKTRLRRVLNPPIVTILLSFLFLVPMIRGAFIQLTVLGQALDLLGQSTIPLVLIILGGSLAERHAHDSDHWKPVLLSAAIRLLVVPWITLILLRGVHVGQLLAFILILQACMPAATNHIVVVKEYGGNAALVSRALMVQYLAAIITVPLFLRLM
jgi:predicted permease